MAELIAIDVLAEPDERIHELALAYNRRFLERVPPPRGFALDETRVPHVTLVQRYVRTDRLDAALAALAATAATADRAAFDLVTDGAPRADRVGADGVASVLWWLTRTPALAELQAALLVALEPFVTSGGDERAFVTSTEEPDVAPSTVRYVETFVPDQIGPAYAPHLTLGRATGEDLTTLAAEPAPSLAFTAPALAAYQLGDHGTARRRLARWPR
jgi:2'-5' RNA ligase